MGLIPQSPKALGLLQFKETGKAAGERWQKGVTGRVVDLVDLDLKPHPELKVRCRQHGETVVAQWKPTISVLLWPPDARCFLSTSALCI